MRVDRLARPIAALLLCSVSPVHAWGPDGHHTVATIASKLIAGSNAEQQVHALLGGLSLADAAVWADCSKGVSPTTFKYGGAGHYPECAVFETPTGEAAMEDFVQRNSTNCVIKPGEETCHKQYHYSDIAIQHMAYSTTFIGARDDDIVAAVVATTQVLKGNPAPAPFNIKDKAEALRLLAHYAGDIHQPLHVGAIYLAPDGTAVNPDVGTFDPATATRGANNIKVLPSKSKNLHATWDAIPKSQTMAHVGPTWIAEAKAVPLSTGSSLTWPAQWASGSVAQANAALSGPTYGPLMGTTWTVKLPAGYSKSMATIKKEQLTLAGARLAQLLQDIWP
jgi:hypothetical protein